MKNERIENITEVQPVEEIKPIVEPIRGVVTDCRYLNVREAPDQDAAVLTTIKALSEVLIDEPESTEDFYKVYTETGIEGYCMKKFIAV